MSVRTLLRGGLFLLAGVFVLPIYLLFAISLKTPEDVAEAPYAPPIPAHTSNYSDAWTSSSGSGSASFGQAFVNSLVITSMSVVILVVLGSLCGYVLGRRSSRLSTFAYAAFIAGLAIPVQLAVLPLYRAMDNLGMTGTRVGMVFFYAGLLMPFTVFLYTGFVRSLPRDFEEASRIDGGSEIRTFSSVVFPLLRPVTVTVVILDAVAVWNDFFGQLIFLNGSGRETLPVTVFTFAGQYTSNYPLLAAGLTMALLPILVFYLALQRRIIAGFSTGLKG